MESRRVGGPRLLTRTDYERVSDIVCDYAPEALAWLEDADLVEPAAIPANVVTMYSQFEVQEIAGSAKRTFVICYPADADPDDGYVSVLSPEGLALLGRRIGDGVSWQAADGGRRAAIITRIFFQPEATGDYVT